MGYTPHNTPVYLRAYAGFISGLTAAITTTTIVGSYTAYAQMADAWAQEVDTQFGAGSPTNFQLDAIEHTAHAIWRERTLEVKEGLAAGSYATVAQSVVARVIAGNAQIVAEGINPNNTGGGGGGGGGGGFTTTESDFTRPPINESQDVEVLDTTLFVPGSTNAAMVPENTESPVGQYLITDRTVETGPGTLTLFNQGGDTGSGLVPFGATLTVASGVLPPAAQVQSDGEAIIGEGGLGTPGGVQKVTSLAKYVKTNTDGSVAGTVGVRAAIAAASAAGTPLNCPQDTYITTDDLIVITESITIQSAGLFADAHIFGPMFAAVNFGGYWGGGYVGDVFAVLPPPDGVIAVKYHKIGNFWWTALNTVGDNQTLGMPWSETPYASIDGWSALCVEWLQNSQTYAAGQMMPSSGGSRSTSMPVTHAFAVSAFNNTPPGNGVNLTLTTVGGIVTAASADQALAFNTDYACALTYDGSTLRMYAGHPGGTSTVIASAAATGTVVQPWWETLWWGVSSQVAGGWPYGNGGGGASMRIGNMRLSNIARYTGAPYTPQSTEFVAADCDAHTWLMASFAPAYTTNTAYPPCGVMLASNPAATGAILPGPANVMTFWYGTIGPGLGAAGPAAQFNNIAFASQNGGLSCNNTVGLQTSGCYFQGSRGITHLNNSYDGVHVNDLFDIQIYRAGSNGYSWCAGLVAVSGGATMSRMTVGTCSATVGFVFSSSGSGVDGLSINTMNGPVGILVNQNSGDFRLTGGAGDEGFASIKDCLVLLDNMNSMKWEGGVFDENGSSSTYPVRIDGGNFYTFIVDLAASPGTAAACINFVSAPAFPVQLAPTQGQLIVPSIPWANGTGVSIQIPVMQMGGRTTFTFPSDANYTPSPVEANKALSGLIVIAGALTADRTLTIPHNLGHVSRWINMTGHNVTVIGPTGTGVVIPTAGNTYDDGTNIDAA